MSRERQRDSTTLDAARTAAYLRRIKTVRPERADLSSLAELQLRHLLNVPFENLDIHLGVPITLDLSTVLVKLLDNNRGGYCYELNSAFAALLITLGYDVDQVAARVAKVDGGFGRDRAHLALIVHIGGRPHLVDVGFGDAFTSPLPLIAGEARSDRDRLVRLVTDGSEWEYHEDRGEGWQVRYAFDPSPRCIADFAEMNEWQQSSPESNFTSRTICSILREDGRMTISNNRLITTNGRGRSEETLERRQLDRALREHFGIVL